MELIRKNFGLKLAAVILAILGWAYFRYNANPLLAARFDQQLSVPIVAINLPVGYVSHYTDKDAVVTVSTKRGEPPVKPEEIKAVLDLTNKTTGVYNVPIQLVAPSVVVQSLSPASITLAVEKIDQKAFPLDVHYSGSQGSVVVGSLSVAPAIATVRAPTSQLSAVTSLRVVAPLPSQPGAFDEMLRPVPVNAMGQEVPGVQVAPDLVRVKITFVEGTGAKSH